MYHYGCIKVVLPTENNELSVSALTNQERRRIYCSGGGTNKGNGLLIVNYAVGIVVI